MTSCSSPKTTEAAPPAAAASASLPNAQLWGDMKPVVSVKELMRDLLDPLADNIFDSVAVVVDQKRTIAGSGSGTSANCAS